MGNQKPIHSPLALPSPLRRRFIQQTTALSLCSALPLAAQVANASQKPHVVTRYSETSVFKYGHENFRGNFLMISIIGEPSSDIESALNLHKREWVCDANSLINARAYSRDRQGIDGEFGTFTYNYDAVGLIMLQDCEPSSLQLLVEEAERYAENNMFFFIGSPGTFNAVAQIQAAVDKAEGKELVFLLDEYWRILQIERVVGDRNLSAITGVAQRMIVYLEAFLMPLVEYCSVLRWDSFYYFLDLERGFDERVIKVTRLRSSSITGLNELLTRELKRYELPYGLMVTAFSMDKTLIKAEVEGRLKQVYNDQSLECIFYEPLLYVTAETNDSRETHDVYMAGNGVC